MFEKKSAEVTKIPPSLSTKVIERAIGTDDLHKLYELYKKARVGTGGMREPSAEEMKMVDMFVKQGASQNEIARTFGVKRNVVGNAIARIALWNLRNGK